MNHDKSRKAFAEIETHIPGGVNTSLRRIESKLVFTLVMLCSRNRLRAPLSRLPGAGSYGVSILSISSFAGQCEETCPFR